MGPVTSSAGLHRALPVPDGLEGQRVDQALSRLFGLSRTAAAEVADAGGVVVDGRSRGKGDRLTAGSWLEVELPPPPGEPVAPRPVEGMTILYDDDDIVVVDKPVGVAAHPSPGWDGPTVIGGLAAAGYRISTSGAAERQGVVHRLDAATTGVMVVAKSERAYTSLKAAFKERTVAKGYHALVQGHPDPSRGTIDAPIDRHPKHDWRFAVVSRRAPVGHALPGDRGVPRGEPGRHPARDRAHAPDPGALLGPAPPVRGRHDLRRGPDAGRAVGRRAAVAARRPAGLPAPRGRPVRRVHQRVPARPRRRAGRAARRDLTSVP